MRTNLLLDREIDVVAAAAVAVAAVATTQKLRAVRGCSQKPVSRYCAADDVWLVGWQ